MPTPLSLLLPLTASLAPAISQPPPASSPAPAPQPPTPTDWKAAEASLLTDHIQITTRDTFIKAGEAYFDHQTPPRWIIFQAVPVPAEGKEPDPFYSMYVAKLKRDGEKNDGTITGIEDPIRISPDGSANTCGWFHPTDQRQVLFGSTLERPKAEQRSGFQVGTRKYVWMFPEEMNIVSRSIPVVVRSLPVGGTGMVQLTEDEVRELMPDGRVAVRAVKTHKRPPEFTDPDTGPAIGAEPHTVFQRPNYDAECSWSPDGHSVLYAHVRDTKDGERPDRPDADIYVFDTRTNEHHPLVTADGYDGGPFFSPDGTRICYRSDRRGDDRLQLFVADLKLNDDGVPIGIAREHQLTDDTNVNWAPYWHPSGEYLLYGTSAMGHTNYEVFAIQVPAPDSKSDPKDLRTRRVTAADGADILPAFSDDGALMMWTAQRGDPAPGEPKPSSQIWIATVRPGPRGLTDPDGLFATTQAPELSD